MLCFCKNSYLSIYLLVYQYMLILNHTLKIFILNDRQDVVIKNRFEGYGIKLCDLLRFI